MTPARSGWLSAALTVGMVLVFVGERLWESGTGRAVLSGLGFALVLAALGLRLVRMARADTEHRGVESLLAVLAGIGTLGLGLYFLQSDLGGRILGERLADSAPRLALVLSALFPICVAASVLPTLLAEAAYASVVRAPRVEVRRIRDAVGAGLGLVAALTLAFAVEYVVDTKDKTWDFSYFRTAKPGEATRKLVQALETPLEVALFFPPGNDVHEELSNYFRPLEGESGRLKVESLDAAVDLARARELNVMANGAVVFKSGQRKETLSVAVDLDRARGDLRRLDQQVQDKLFALTRPRRTVYLTGGHGERQDRGGGPDTRARIATFKKILEALNQDVKPLTAADGLASEIPSDAAAVLIVGPTNAFLPEELAALNRYFTRGGRILVALDPENAPDLSPLLAPLGVSFQKTVLVNDRFYIPHAHTPSDKANIGTATFSSHPAVTSLAQTQGRYPMIFLGAGYLEEAKAKPVQLSVDFAVRSHPTTFDDLNGNFVFDPPAEVRKSWPIVAASSRHTFGKPGERALDSRALVLADSDCLTDLVIESAGNAFFARDALIWLIGEEAVAGTVNRETDVKIEHTRGQDTAYFYLTVFAVPVVVLGAGIVGTRRRPKRRTT